MDSFSDIFEAKAAIPKQPKNVKIANFRKLSIAEFKKLNYKQQAMAIFAYYFQYDKLTPGNVFQEMAPPAAKINSKTARLVLGYEALYTGDHTYGIEHSIPFNLTAKEAMAIMKGAGVSSRV